MIGHSYITGNVLSSGDYADESVFYGLPDETERIRYAALLESLTMADTRYCVITRTTETPGDDGDTVTESETSVITRPSPVWLADMLAMVSPAREASFAGHRSGFVRYYSDVCEYYSTGVSGGVAVPVPVTETYCVDIAGLSRARLDVIETSAGIARA